MVGDEPQVGLFGWDFKNERLALNAWRMLRDRYLGQVGYSMSVWRVKDARKQVPSVVVFVHMQTRDQVISIHAEIAALVPFNHATDHTFHPAEVEMFVNRRLYDEITSIISGKAAMVDSPPGGYNDGRGLFMHLDGGLSRWPEPHGHG